MASLRSYLSTTSTATLLPLTKLKITRVGHAIYPRRAQLLETAQILTAIETKIRRSKDLKTEVLTSQTHPDLPDGKGAVKKEAATTEALGEL